MARSREGAATVRFYQLGHTGLEAALLRIVGKAYDQGLRVVIHSPDPEQLRRLDDALWREPPDGFLPHAPCGGADDARQPVLLCREPRDDNGATVAVALGEPPLAAPERFDLVVEFVPPGGDDAPPVVAARRRYAAYRKRGCAMEYWVQGPRGWSKRK